MKTALVITTFNRPNYLRECLDSVKRANVPAEDVLIVDDCSDNEETKKLIRESGYQVLWKLSRAGIKNSLLAGYTMMFGKGYDLVINLDGDGVIRNDAVEVLVGLKKLFPDNIVSGFNTTVKNRNPIIDEYSNYFFKKYASGICLCINKNDYEKYLLPALQKPVGNFDFDASLLHGADGKAVVVSRPSVVQHIGVISAMGHAVGGEPMDVAEDFKPLHLPMVTLVGATGNNVEGLEKSMAICEKHIKFGQVKLFNLDYLTSKSAYNKFVLKEMVEYIETPFFLIVQPDSYVVNWKAWSNEFLSYDIVGAWWGFYPDGMGCSNGGFALRSRRLHKILKRDDTIVSKNDNIIKNCEEDHLIGRVYRKYLEDTYQIKFAPKEVCEKFSIEAWGEKPPHNKYKGSFGFHSVWVDFNDADLEYKPYHYPNLSRNINYNPTNANIHHHV